MKKDLYEELNPYHRESKNYYRNGERKNMVYRKCGYSFTYRYESEYLAGVGNTLAGLIHALMSHGNVSETVTVYKNGKLLKQWKRN